MLLFPTILIKHVFDFFSYNIHLAISKNIVVIYVLFLKNFHHLFLGNIEHYKLLQEN